MRPLMTRDSIDVNGPASVKVIGIGGAGTNILGTLFMKDFDGTEFRRVNRIDGPELCCISTDAHHLDMSPVGTKILIGPNTTHGMGTRGDALLGKRAAEESEDEIIGFLDGGKMVFLIAGLGGGTGTGASKHIANTCKSLRLTIVGIFIMPFENEKGNKEAKAQEALGDLYGSCDIALTMKNDFLLGSSSMPSLNAAFEATARFVSGAIEDVLQMTRYIRQPDNASR